MKGKIGKNGSLYIERAENMTAQACPFSTDEPCGDWCPLFGEPMRHKNKWILNLCQPTLLFEEFVDERKESATNISQSNQKAQKS